MRVRVIVIALALAALVGLQAGPSHAQVGGDVLVSNGSPASPFSQNKQNEPAVAIDANHSNILAAGSNDNIDMEACNSGTDNTCPFTDRHRWFGHLLLVRLRYNMDATDLHRVDRTQLPWCRR